MRKLFSRYLPVLLVVGLLLGFPRAAAAQDADPPGRVARLNYAQGAVSFQASGEKDWVDANLNRPLTTGDNLWVDKDSSGEVHIGSTAIRLSSETGISILNLDDRTAQIQLVQGTIEVHLRRLESGNAWEIDTPNVAFTLTRAGEYLIQADPDGGSTVFIVREGEGQVTGAGESWDLTEGQQYTFAGTDQLPPSMTSKIGARNAISARIIPSLRGTSQETLTATTISTTPEPGKMIRTTARFGFQRLLLVVGHLTTSAIGCGSVPGAGPGLQMNRGASLWPLGPVRRLLGLGARPYGRPALLRTRPGRICRRWLRLRGRLRQRLFGSSLVSARAT